MIDVYILTGCKRALYRISEATVVNDVYIMTGCKTALYRITEATVVIDVYIRSEERFSRM